MIKNNNNSKNHFVNQPGRLTLSEAIADITSGISCYSIWYTLALIDIKQRYRRSILGPFWITINSSVIILMISMVFSRIFKIELHLYVPFFAIGTIIWNFYSTTLNESCGTFLAVDSLMRQTRLPVFTHIMRVLSRNVFIFLHNFFVIIFVLIYFNKVPQISFVIEFIVGLSVVIINLSLISVPVAIISTRFRDVGQIIQNFIQAMYYITPIMWMPDLIPAGNLSKILLFNPFYYYVEILRSPLLSQEVSNFSYIIILGTTVFLFVGAIASLIYFKKRIVYWI